jgi:hypothetical protein
MGHRTSCQTAVITYPLKKAKIFQLQNTFIYINPTLTPNAITVLTISKVMHQASNIKTTTAVYFQCEEWWRELHTLNSVTSDRAWSRFH